MPASRPTWKGRIQRWGRTERSGGSVNHRARVYDKAWRVKKKEEDRKAGRG